MNRLIFVLLILVSASGSAQQSKSLEQLQREEQLQKAMAVINEVDAKLNQLVKRRQAECDMAIGYAPFCTCVLADLPVAWTFSDYVAITTRTKEDNGYAKMDKELRNAYDKVAPIRDKCVRKISAKP